MPLEKPGVYEGDRPYIFICYEHADCDAVLPMIDALAGEGYRIWYDDGIQAGTPILENTANHLHDCSCVLALVSSSWVASERRRKQVEYALGQNKPVLLVYLEDVELPRDLQMLLGDVQPLPWHAYDTDEGFNERLFSASVLDPCLTDEGKRRRGVKPRNNRVTNAMPDDDALLGEQSNNETTVGQSGMLQSDTDGISPSDVPSITLSILYSISVGLLIVVCMAILAIAISTTQNKSAQPKTELIEAGKTSEEGDDINQADSTGEVERSSTDTDIQPDQLVPGVPVRLSIDDYTWDDLKALALAISNAGENEWLGIAKTYNLVDQDGMLQGETKSITLTDGTHASVRIIGFRHDVLQDGGVAGITFEFSDVPKEHEINPESTNVGGWESSDMRERLNAGFINLLPSELSPHIQEVKKLTNNTGKLEPEDDTTVVTETLDRIWLLSLCEVYDKTSTQFENIPHRSDVYDAEGVQYQLYADQGVIAASCGFCCKYGDDSFWWLRSPYVDETGCFLYVSYDGAWNYISADFNFGVSPGFCL